MPSTPTPTTRASLLIKLRDPQDHEAWVEFVEIYEPAVYRQLRKCGLQDADARERMPGDDRMQGDWVLESVTGRGLRAMAPGLKVHVRGSDWTIHRAGGKTSARLTVNPYVQPSTIDMQFFDGNAESGASRGLYRIEGEILQFFWSPKAEVRPGSYGDPDVSIHTYRRASPSELRN